MRSQVAVGNGRNPLPDPLPQHGPHTVCDEPAAHHHQHAVQQGVCGDVEFAPESSFAALYGD